MPVGREDDADSVAVRGLAAPASNAKKGPRSTRARPTQLRETSVTTLSVAMWPRSRRIGVIVLVATCLTAAFLALARLPSNARMGRLNTRFEFVDEMGQPLDEVFVGLEWGRRYFTPSIHLLIDNGSHERRYTADRMFTVRLNDVAWVELYFSKDGFLSRSWKYSFLGSHRDGRALDNPLPPATIQVVLQKKPDYPPMEKVKGLLSYSVGGPCPVLWVGQSMRTENGEESPSARRWRTPGRAESPVGLKMCCSLDEEGELPTRLYEFERTSHLSRFVGVVGSELMVVGGDEEDGIQEIELEPEYYEAISLDDSAAEIIRAPRSGYKSVLILGQDNDRGTAFFCIRIGGFYGKGYVGTHPVIVGDGDEQEARSFVKIWMSTDLTRNVATWQTSAKPVRYR